jgi:alkylation response protein AidB-like acyl-CoA dehydrogenase
MDASGLRDKTVASVETGVRNAVPGERDHIVAETAARILADFADPLTINKAKDDAWKEPLWQALSNAGLPLAWLPDALGGRAQAWRRASPFSASPGASLCRRRWRKRWLPPGC